MHTLFVIFTHAGVEGGFLRFEDAKDRAEIISTLAAYRNRPVQIVELELSTVPEASITSFQGTIPIDYFKHDWSAP